MLVTRFVTEKRNCCNKVSKECVDIIDKGYWFIAV